MIVSLLGLNLKALSKEKKSLTFFYPISMWVARA